MQFMVFLKLALAMIFDFFTVEIDEILSFFLCVNEYLLIEMPNVLEVDWQLLWNPETTVGTQFRFENEPLF